MACSGECDGVSVSGNPKPLALISSSAVTTPKGQTPGQGSRARMHHDSEFHGLMMQAVRRQLRLCSLLGTVCQTECQLSLHHIHNHTECGELGQALHSATGD